MAVPVGAIVKAAATVLTNEKLRKGVGWILVAVLSPLILIIAVICSLATGGADHNNQAVAATFYGSSYSAEVPAEFRYHIEEMRTAFSLLDSAVSSANGQMDSGNGLDPIRVKAVFYALCFGEDAPSSRAANRFVECFYTTETRTRTVEVENEDGTVTTTEEEYTAVVPVSLYQAYANLEAQLGRTITEDDKSNINHIYSMIAGAAGGGNYGGEFLRGDGSSIELDISTFTDPTTKNAADLVTYAIHAWESGWGYVWGTYGCVLTDSLFAYKLEQYPDGVGNYEDFIRANWLGGRTTDCVGLIKGYGWLNPETLSIDYATNGMPDIGANQMYYSASVSGTIDTMPDKPGLAVWHDGHIGVYIGDGYVIEAMENKPFHSVYRGDIFYADLEPVIGSEQGGIRPVLVIQNDIGNRHSPTVIVAAITSRIKHRHQPTHVHLDGRQCGLPNDSTIMLEQLRTLDKQRLLGYIGSIGKAKMKEVDQALEISVGTSKKPLPP